MQIPTAAIAAFFIGAVIGGISQIIFLTVLRDVNRALEPGREFPWFICPAYCPKLWEEHRRLHPASHRRAWMVGCWIVGFCSMLPAMVLAVEQVLGRVRP